MSDRRYRSSVNAATCLIVVATWTFVLLVALTVYALATWLS